MQKSKSRDYDLTLPLLTKYRDAALENARELMDEAAILLRHDHHARAYFLSVAAIEEIGKAVQAFDGMGRNLKNSAVSHRLKIQFEDHSKKINSAFIPWLLASPNPRDEIKSFISTMINVSSGREPSMYTDVHYEGTKVSSPRAVVRPVAAENCLRLAETVFLHATPYVTKSLPKITTKTQDEFFALKPTVFLKMANTADFWEYYISRMEAGDKALETAVTTYHMEFFSKNRLFVGEG